jgi:hypothetical protein
MPYKKSNKEIQNSRMEKTYGSPFEMRAKAYNNSPMQKNFGGNLAINKKLDKDSMSGGLTGQPSGETGKLGHGPIMKKTSSPMRKGGTSPTPPKSKGGTKPAPKLTKFNAGVQKTAKNIGSNFKADVNKFAGKIGLKKSGNIGAKLKNKYSTKAQKAGTVAKAGESQHQFKTRTRKSAPKAAKSNAATLNKPTDKVINVKTKNNLTLGGNKNQNIVHPSNKTTTNAKAVKGTKKNTYGVLKSQKNKKTNAYTPWSFKK